MTGQQLPVAKYKAGQVSSAIWKDEIRTQRGPVPIYRVTVQRRYKDKNGEWRSSGSFNRNEIPLVKYCLDKAYDKIIDLQNEDSGNGNNVEEITI